MQAKLRKEGQIGGWVPPSPPRAESEAGFDSYCHGGIEQNAAW